MSLLHGLINPFVFYLDRSNLKVHSSDLQPDTLKVQNLRAFNWIQIGDPKLNFAPNLVRLKSEDAFCNFECGLRSTFSFKVFYIEK